MGVLTLQFLQAKASGKMLFEQVCKQLNLLETDYFGLEYTDNRGSTYWLDRDKPMNQQVIGIVLIPCTMYHVFIVNLTRLSF